MKIIICGGGTGGHFYPGYVIAKKMIENSHTVVMAVKKNDISLDILKEEDIPFIEIDIIAFPRSLNPIKLIIFFIKLIKSVFFSLIVINDFKPDCVIGTGSYVSFPMIFAAAIKGVKIFIHESNAVYGIGNIISGYFADKVFLGLPTRNKRFYKKTILSGTPIRENFFKEMNRSFLREKFGFGETEKVITVFGGSQGSKNINEAIYDFVLKNKTEKLGYRIVQITGNKNYQEIKEKYERYELLNGNLLFPYYEHMEELYLISDLVISRSGASTIAELIYTKTPAILIPLPFSALDHQYENARILFENNCAIILKDDENLRYNLTKNIIYLFTGNRLEVMKKAFAHLRIPSGKEPIEIIINTITK